MFVCGTLNAKNEFGGYAGPTQFVGFGSMVLTSHDKGFPSTRNDTCAIGKKIADIAPRL